MASNREEAYEVNLGNKQLLALFFIVTGFFALFFCAGYMVGFGHGEDTAPAIVQADEPEPKQTELQLPATLRQANPCSGSGRGRILPASRSREGRGGRNSTGRQAQIQGLPRGGEREQGRWLATRGRGTVREPRSGAVVQDEAHQRRL